MILAVILLTALTNILLGIISYKKQPNSATNRLLTGLAAIFALWTIANYLSLNTPSASGTLFWIRAVMFITAPLGPVLYLFIKAFPHAELKVNKLVLSLLIAATLVVEAIAFTPLIFSSVTMTPQITPTPGPGIVLFALLFAGIPLISIFEIIKKYKKATGIEKQQLKYLVSGISFPFVLLIFTNFIAVIVFKYSNFVIFGPMFSLIFVGFIFYAIVRHRLLAIRLILARSVAYSFLIAVMASIYTLGVFFVSRYVFETESTTPQRITSALLALFVVLTFEPIKNAIQRATDHVFFRGKYNTNELMFELTALIASTIKLKTLTEHTLAKILTTMRIERGAFLIIRKQSRYTLIYDGYRTSPSYKNKKDLLDKLSSLNRMIILDEEKEPTTKHLMHQLGIAVAVPLSERGQNEGFLLLGSKKSGETYTPQDITLLEIFGPIMSLAIQNAKSYEEIKSFNKTLSDKIEAATKEIQVSHEKLKVLDRQKDKFLGMASHELKTPITSIKAFTQVLQRKLEKGGITDYSNLLENVNTQTDKVTKLINDLLNVSNIEAGKLVLEQEAFDGDQLVTKTVSNMQYTADNHQIIKEGKITRPLIGDADRISQVLSNLLTNAIKYSPNADRIVVSVSEDNKNVTVRVIDYGPGISADDQKRIFERFYRTKDHEERNIAGFGLGLYISAEIIKRHGGKLWVESTKGKGSTFSFSLPLHNQSSE